jgi:hypothetical protein
MKDSILKKGLFIITCILSFCYLLNFSIMAFSENIILKEFLKTEGLYIFFWFISFVLSLGYLINYCNQSVCKSKLKFGDKC